MNIHQTIIDRARKIAQQTAEVAIDPTMAICFNMRTNVFQYCQASSLYPQTESLLPFVPPMYPPLLFVGPHSSEQSEERIFCDYNGFPVAMEVARAKKRWASESARDRTWMKHASDESKKNLDEILAKDVHEIAVNDFVYFRHRASLTVDSNASKIFRDMQENYGRLYRNHFACYLTEFVVVTRSGQRMRIGAASQEHAEEIARKDGHLL